MKNSFVAEENFPEKISDFRALEFQQMRCYLQLKNTPFLLGRASECQGSIIQAVLLAKCVLKEPGTTSITGPKTTVQFLIPD